MNWNELHTLQRHLLHYPSEEVVRFLAAAEKQGRRDFLDIGCGAGRHMRLAGELGLYVSGVDSSESAVEIAAEWGNAQVGEMTALPYEDATFDVAVAFGALYYATFPDLLKSVSELHRILEPGGIALISLRTTDDYRYGMGDPMSWHTLRLAMPGEPEDGAVVTFMPAAFVPSLFRSFSGSWVELAERTTHSRMIRNSDWLVTVKK